MTAKSRTERAFPILLLILLCTAVVPATSWAASDDEDDDRHEVKIEIKKITSDCDEDAGDDCAEVDVRHQVFVSHDGDVHEIEGGRGDVTWIRGHGLHRALAFVGGDHPRHFGSGSYLGVALTELSPELRTHFGVPDDAGVMVSQVIAGSPAEVAGVRVGDIITSVNGERVGSARSLARRIGHLDEGEIADLELYRDGRLQTLSATVAARPEHELTTELHGDDVDFRDLKALGCEGDCDITIECDDGECACTVDGEEAACPELHRLGLHRH